MTDQSASTSPYPSLGTQHSATLAGAGNPNSALCRCGHPDSHHDAGECWTDAGGRQTWDETACPCNWWELAPNAPRTTPMSEQQAAGDRSSATPLCDDDCNEPIKYYDAIGQWCAKHCEEENLNYGPLVQVPDAGSAHVPGAGPAPSQDSARGVADDAGVGVPPPALTCQGCIADAENDWFGPPHACEDEW